MSVAATSLQSAGETSASWRVPLSDVRVDDELEQAVVAAVRSGWWSMGPRVAEFEREFASYTGSRCALAVANGTAALHLALLALDCGPGDEVIVPSLTFVAAANTVGHVGATPVFCDVTSAEDLNLSAADVEAAITPATKAIMVAHYGGHACDMAAILKVAARHGLPVIEDAAHALGATYAGKACGTIGAIGCFSFFANKNLSTAEGGMVVTDDHVLADRLSLLRSHGMTTLTWDRHRGHAHTYDVVAQGLNYRLDELRAAIGLLELRRLDERTRARAAIVQQYRAELDGVEGISIPFADDETAAHHLAVVAVPEGSLRSGVRAGLTAMGIQTSVHYPPIHRFSFYRTLGEQRALPVTEDVAERIVTLPLYPHMTAADVDAVTSGVLDVVRHNEAATARGHATSIGGTPWN